MVLPANRDYTTRDFESLRARAIGLIRSAFPEWTEFSEASFDTLLIEQAPFVGDLLAFYIDAAARESRWSTARTRAAIISLSKLVGFRPRGTLASSAAVEFTLADVPAGDFMLDSGTVVRTRSAPPVEFELQEPLLIEAGADPPTATALAENSVTVRESFQSIDQPNQKFMLALGPYVDRSMVVSAADGPYDEEESGTLLLAGPEDQVFVMAVGDEAALLVFGNGASGSIPVGTINVIYRVGGGGVGNVDAGQIIDIDGPFSDSLGNSLELSIVNPERAQGGDDPQSADELRVIVPAVARSPRTTVGFDDFVTNSQRVAGVARALPLSSDQEAGIPENTVFLYIIPDGGGDPSEVLKSSVVEALTVTFPKGITLRLDPRNPVYLLLDIEARVFRSPGASQGEVRANIDAALAARFAISLPGGGPNPQVDFGFNIKDVNGDPAGEVAWSQLLTLMNSTDGVRKIGDGDADFLLNGASDDVLISNKEFPQLGTVVLVDGDTGELF